MQEWGIRSSFFTAPNASIRRTKKKEKKMIVEKPIFIYQPINVGDYEITLLSKEEYIKNRELIPLIEDFWWLRSPGNNDNKAAFVYGVYGDVSDRGTHAYSKFGVRPALKIEHYEHLKPGERVRINGLVFTVLNDGILLCNVILGEVMFDETSNDYDRSYIKHWLKRWAEDKLSEEQEDS